MTLEQRSDSAAAGHEACDQPIRSLEILNQCVPLFETLKDPNRQQLLVQLVCHGPQTVGELAESSALSRTAVSHHIKLLEQAGFIEISKTPPAAFARCVRIDGCRCSMNCLPP